MLRKLLPATVALSLFVCAFVSPPGARTSSPNIVISQVYGGGGNQGSTYKNDFIELFNRGMTPVDVTGWTLQYASGGGSTWFNTVTLRGTIAPGRYYLVQEGGDIAGVINLPTPDAIGITNLSAISGKVALVSSSTSLSGLCPTGGGIEDFVGYGNTNCFEGSPAPELNNARSAIRVLNGYKDTDNNAADFIAIAPPNPRSSRQLGYRRLLRVRYGTRASTSHRCS